VDLENSVCCIAIPLKASTLCAIKRTRLITFVSELAHTGDHQPMYKITFTTFGLSMHMQLDRVHSPSK